jgi:outer membrane protein assembly factor BamE (lipoprotein component of BamABCDE complex)
MTEVTLAIPRKPGSKALLVVGGLALAAAIYWVVFRCPLPFVASWWNVDSEQGTALQTRYRVADRLTSSGRLNGMTQTEVVALLGAPTDTDKFKDHRLVYVLGPERGFISIDYEWLAIDFDPAGKVSKAAVVSD